MYNRRSQISKGKLVVLAAAILCAVVYVLTGGSATVVNTAPFELEKRIVLDAGHGGIDGGATGAHGELEKEINLNIVLQLKSLLEMQGFEVVTTREEDISIHDEKFEKISEQKISDIKNRLKIMEENKDGITISIHQNKFTQEKYNGAQVFYGSKNPLSKQLAQVMQDSFVKNLQPDNTREIKEGTGSVYLLKHATVPMIMIECGFLSNEAEAVLLATEEYQQKIAFTIFSGIMEFYGTTV